MQQTVDLAKVSPMITVLVDASYSHQTGLSGWAAWCVCDGQRVKGEGFPRHQVKSSNDAEWIAIVRGFQLALESFRPIPNTRVLIQSDSTVALSRLDPRRWMNDVEKRYGRVFNDMREAFPNLRIEGRHVKGHQSSKKGARFYCNNWADERSRVQRIQAENIWRKHKSFDAIDIPS